MGGEKYIQKEYTSISAGIGVGVEEIQNMMSITHALKFWYSPLEVCQVDTAEPVTNLERPGENSGGQISLYVPLLLKTVTVATSKEYVLELIS